MRTGRADTGDESNLAGEVARGFLIHRSLVEYLGLADGAGSFKSSANVFTAQYLPRRAENMFPALLENGPFFPEPIVTF